MIWERAGKSLAKPTAWIEREPEKAELLQLIAALILFAAAIILEDFATTATVLFIAAAVVAGFDLIIRAARDIQTTRYLGDSLLILLAAVAYFSTGNGLYGAALLLLFKLVSMLLSYTVNRVRARAIEGLKVSSRYARVFRGGVESALPSDEINIGEILLVGPGESFPVDCTVIDGSSLLDYSSLAASPELRRVESGSRILAGAVNSEAPLRCLATATVENSALISLCKRIGTDEDTVGRTERRIKKMLRVFSYAMLAAAVLFIVGMSVFGSITLRDSLGRALTALVVGCSEALALSMPLVSFAGVYAALRKGVAFTGSAAMDASADVKAVIFDTTGVLLTGELRVTAIKSGRLDAETMLKTAAHVAALSQHRCAKAIRAAYRGEVDTSLVTDFAEELDKGVSARLGAVSVRLGMSSFIQDGGTRIDDKYAGDLSVYMSVDGSYAGRFSLSESTREEALSAVLRLESVSGSPALLISEEKAEICERVAAAVGISEYYGDCSDENKAAHIRERKKRLAGRGALMFIGGQDCTEAISAADVGVTIGGIDCFAPERSEVIIMSANPLYAELAIRISRSVRYNMYVSLCIIFTVRLLLLVTGGMGIVPVWLVLVIDMLCTFIFVFRSCHTFLGKKAEIT